MGTADGGQEYNDMEKQLATAPPVTVPAITIEGDANGAPHSEAGSYANKFSGKYSHKVFQGIGHNLPQEAPEGFARAIIEVDAY